jgi:hypothetical protein
LSAVTGLFEPLHVLPARARRQANQLRELQIADGTIMLEPDQNIDVDTVQF